MSRAEIIIFSAITSFLIWISWNVSLKEKRFHGFTRFFAFESIVLLFILNYRYWFVNPLSFQQLFSWAFLTGSAIFAIVGFVLLTKLGHPEGNIENTSHLITTGIYRYIRHPLYLSLLLLGFGIMLKHPVLSTWILAIINMTSVFFTARIEEKEMIMKFGEAYREYMKKSKMFIPLIF
ncbi:MAG TPA: isoprenylcysteine carboxylmethyltransferase family protein [Cyclobacteriaceae bacterium]|nr:isoprenylcysteine carboxylmethyltransferase family protein [Cyclobacteriaceae bacterium]